MPKPGCYDRPGRGLLAVADLGSAFRRPQPEEGQKLLERTEAADPSIRCSSPFMMHYYLEALYTCGLSEKALQCIRTYWGAIADAGFDCCPECFDPRNERLSPYGQPALNSACHAWSCTPSYWLRKYHNKAE